MLTFLNKTLWLPQAEAEALVHGADMFAAREAADNIGGEAGSIVASGAVAGGGGVSSRKIDYRPGVYGSGATSTAGADVLFVRREKTGQGSAGSAGAVGTTGLLHSDVKLHTVPDDLEVARRSDGLMREWCAVCCDRE